MTTVLINHAWTRVSDGPCGNWTHQGNNRKVEGPIHSGNGNGFNAGDRQGDHGRDGYVGAR
ncbi:uncharacterized protein N7484_002746 [Penicillium longicatenatum]|uniref:uncharacterized protein n=1 Tax=Penicillium longicatenatum TaxID=1561947 RepID=UPI002548C2BF|nr:uncharacterized protein N7484_002746 [Penicillium longicatenatum]KAJ5649023.1 hypothetical protein N7484_002746 [Penicillium longicatenatum]